MPDSKRQDGELDGVSETLSECGVRSVCFSLERSTKSPELSLAKETKDIKLRGAGVSLTRPPFSMGCTHKYSDAIVKDRLVPKQIPYRSRKNFITIQPVFSIQFL